MSAELVDPFATPHEPDLTAEEWVAIRDEIHDRPWDDRTRFQDCLTEALKALGEVGLRGDPWSRRTATQALRRMVFRAHTGTPYDEPREPDWSLDPDPKQYRRGER